MGKPRLALTFVFPVLACAVVALLVPYLPAGPDLYAHLLWSQQAARCLAHGQLPLWLPDLNAGFGSPGIRLHNPLAPMAVGALGLILGDVGRALRVVWVVALWALFVVARRFHPDTKGLPWLLLWANPVMPFLLFHRTASLEFLALPLTLSLLEAALQARGSIYLEALGWAALWLLHTPSFIMTACLVVFASFTSKPIGDSLFRRLVPLGLGFALTAWHWLPLITEKNLVHLQEGLTSGIYAATSNFLFAPHPHDVFAVRRLEGLAIVWSAIAVMGLVHQRRRGVLIVASILLATPLTYPLWMALPPLQLLQFPWRFLTPASLLLPWLTTSFSPRQKKLAAALWLIPHLWMPPPSTVRDPAITGRESWTQLGRKLFAAISGNPLVVDVVHNRPLSYAALGDNLKRFGEDTLAFGPGPVTVQEWSPLRRRVLVEAQSAGFLELRLLAYPWWQAWVDGKAVQKNLSKGVVAVPVAPGLHRITVSWEGNPITPWGWVVAALALVLLLLLPRTGARRWCGPPGPPPGTA